MRLGGVVTLNRKPPRDTSLPATTEGSVKMLGEGSAITELPPSTLSRHRL
jgi:hypothetical protein